MENKLTRRIICFILAFAMVFTTIVTGDLTNVKAETDYSQYGGVYFFTNSDRVSPISSISVAKNSTITVYSNHSIHWSIQNDSFAKIVGSSDGESVTISVLDAAANNVKVYGSYALGTGSVSSANISSFTINIYDTVDLKESDLSMKEHYTKTFNVKDRCGEFFTYKLSDLSTVDFANPDAVTNTRNKSVELSAKKQGTVTLTVMAFSDWNGANLLSQKTFTITVGEAPFYLYTDSNCTDENIAAASYDLSNGEEKSFFIDSPFAVSDSNFASSNAAVATVTRDRWNNKKFYVEAVGNGTAVITFTNTYGQTVAVTINAYIKPSSIDFTQDDYYLNLGYQAQTAYTISPANAIGNVTFESTNTNVCTISPTGVITATGAGSCDIKVKVGNCTGWAEVHVTAPSVSISSSSIYVGQKAQVSFSGGDGVRWSSSNSRVASVDANGVVTGKKKGSAIIIGTSSAGTQASATITVSNPTLSNTRMELYIKGTDKLKVTGGSGRISWSSSNKKVATVNKNGRVTAVKKGTCYIYAKRNGVRLKCKVIVKNPKLSSRKIVTYNNMETYLSVYGGSGKITWKSSNSKVASVNKSGKITAKKTGTCTITAKRNGVKLKCKVTVKKNQAVFYKSTNPYDYYAVEFIPKKVYYSGNSIVVDAMMVNGRSYKLNKLDYITVYVKSSSGYTTIASKTFYNCKMNLGAKKTKSVRFKISGAYVQEKHYNLTNGIQCYASGRVS